MVYRRMHVLWIFIRFVSLHLPECHEVQICLDLVFVLLFSVIASVLDSFIQFKDDLGLSVSVFLSRYIQYIM